MKMGSIPLRLTAILLTVLLVSPLSRPPVAVPQGPVQPRIIENQTRAVEIYLMLPCDIRQQLESQGYQLHSQIVEKTLREGGIEETALLYRPDKPLNILMLRFHYDENLTSIVLENHSLSVLTTRIICYGIAENLRSLQENLTNPDAREEVKKLADELDSIVSASRTTIECEASQAFTNMSERLEILAEQSQGHECEILLETAETMTKASTFTLNMLAERLSLAYKSIEEALKIAENLSASQTGNIEIQETVELLKASAEHLKKAIKQIEDLREEAKIQSGEASNPVTMDLEVESVKAYLIEAIGKISPPSEGKNHTASNPISVVFTPVFKALDLLAFGKRTIFRNISGIQRLTYEIEYCYVCVDIDWSCVIELLGSASATIVACIAALSGNPLAVAACISQIMSFSSTLYESIFEENFCCDRAVWTPCPDMDDGYAYP